MAAGGSDLERKVRTPWRGSAHQQSHLRGAASPSSSAAQIPQPPPVLPEQNQRPLHVDAPTPTSRPDSLVRRLALPPCLETTAEHGRCAPARLRSRPGMRAGSGSGSCVGMPARWHGARRRLTEPSHLWYPGHVTIETRTSTLATGYTMAACAAARLLRCDRPSGTSPLRRY